MKRELEEAQKHLAELFGADKAAIKGATLMLKWGDMAIEVIAGLCGGLPGFAVVRTSADKVADDGYIFNACLAGQHFAGGSESDLLGEYIIGTVNEAQIAKINQLFAEIFGVDGARMSGSYLTLWRGFITLVLKPDHINGPPDDHVSLTVEYESEDERGVCTFYGEYRWKLVGQYVLDHHLE